MAREELRWWVVRREIGLAAGSAAGETIARLYAALYDVPVETVAEAGKLAVSPPRSAIAARRRIREGPTGRGAAYWPEVARLLRLSYRRLAEALA